MAKPEPADKDRKATVKMPESLWRKMKSSAALRGITLNQAFTEAATAYVQNGR